MLIIIIWELLYLCTNSYIFPEFFSTFKLTLTYFFDKEVLINVGFSLYRIFIVIIISTILGYFLGSIAGFFKFFGEINKPLIYFITAIPSVCLIYILIIYTSLVSYVLVFLLTFPIIYKACYSGSTRINDEYKLVLTLEGKYSLKNFTKVILPLNLPYLSLGLTQAVPLALKGEIMSEVFISSTSAKGLGLLIRNAYSYDFDINRLFALTLFGIILISVFDFIFNKLRKIKIKVNY